jgi:threonylcarbamoyladenosine tRNA methylthiotransferase MtaB
MPELHDVEIVTFGCRLNAFESEVIRRHALTASLSDTVILHTCAVTAEAERQARQAIRRARRTRPNARIVVTGCSAQITSGAYAAMPEVDHVIGNAEKLKPETWSALAQARAVPRVEVGDIMLVRETAGHLIDGVDGRTRAFLEVQQGCDHRCTFCIIPYGRGPSRSVPPERIIEQARMLLAAGYRELVVTGVDITSYGRDLTPRLPLGAMLARVLGALPDLLRLRVSSVDPAELDSEFETLLTREARLMPHLHLSVQAGDDLVLKRMKRRHLRRDVVELCQRLRRSRPDLVFGADLIAGFPTETDRMFESTLELIEEADLTHLHVFPYSPRPGTPAARMPQVPHRVGKQRAARLRAAGHAGMARFLERQVGRTHSVLFEGDGTGRTEQFAPVRFADGAGPPKAGSILDLKITGTADGMLLGSACG